MKNAINSARVAMTTIGLTLAASQALAVPLNITMGDPQTISETTGNSWQKGGTGVLSDYQEVEPGMLTGTVWDLAAFTADTTAKTLGIVSGYDLRSGYSGTTLGDIFVSANLPVPTTYPEFPSGGYPRFEKNYPTFQWDFAIKLVWTSATGGNYQVYSLTNNSVLENGEYSNNNGNYNAASMPWKLASSTGNGYGVDNLSGPKDYGILTSLGSTFTYDDNAGADAAGRLTAGTAFTDSTLNSTFNVDGVQSTDYKNFLQLDNMGWLASFQDSAHTDYFHTTMWCGNDDLWGSTAVGFQVGVPDGGMTLAMLGLGLAGLAGFSRRKRA